MTDQHPAVDGYTWRPMTADDAGSLLALARACGPLDGETHPPTLEEFATLLGNVDLDADTLCAADADGKLAAYGMVEYAHHLADTYRAFLDGRVHPDYRGRGLGDFILRWMETRARQHHVEAGEERGLLLRHAFYDRAADAIELLETHGFEYSHAEDELMYPLDRPLPDKPLPDGFRLENWRDELIGDFYLCYQEGFAERLAGRPGWSRENFVAAETSGGFRAELTFVALEGDEPAGYVISHVEGDEGWIAQIATRPAFQGRGLASALMAKVFALYKAEGLKVAMLDVGVDNEKARRVYEFMGFELKRRYTAYQKR